MSQYVERIQIHDVRHLQDIDIHIGGADERGPRHLILTGPNGSGKTSVLEALVSYFGGVPNQHLVSIPTWQNSLAQIKRQIDTIDSQLSSADEAEWKTLTSQRESIQQSANNIESVISPYTKIEPQIRDIAGLTRLYRKGAFLLAYFPAERKSAMTMPTGVKKIQPKETYAIGETARSEFLNYLVHLTVQRSFARDSRDADGVAEIDAWFERFEGALRDLYDDPDLKLLFDRDNYRHTIQLGDGREPFDLNQLADGYHAMLSIVAELIVRMDAKAPRVYDLPGIVLIDEVETHLHIEMQKVALPFLTAFFPRIQFIATTHSPFVLMSLPNAVVFDLTSHLREEDLTGYSSEAIVQGHFDQSKYSERLQADLEEYRALWARRNSLHGKERDRFDDLCVYIHDLPKAFSPELETVLREIEGDDA